MTWLVLGSSGQLGHAMHEILESQNVKHINLNREEVDITDNLVYRKLQQFKPSLIINCAAWTKVDAAEKNIFEARLVNRNGARNLAKAAKKFKVPFLHFSSDYVFSGKKTLPWKTDDNLVPQNSYGLTKMEGEIEILKIYSEGTYIVRTAWLYSPWKDNFAKKMLRNALLNEKSYVVTDQIGQPTSAIDLAKQTHILLCSKANFGVFHGTNGGSASWFDFAQQIYRLAGSQVKLVQPISSKNKQNDAKRPTYSVLDHSKWIEENLTPMRDWKQALLSIFPRLLSEVKKEINDESI